MRQHGFIHGAVLTSIPSLVLSPQDVQENDPRAVFAASPACVLISVWPGGLGVLWVYPISGDSKEQLPCLSALQFHSSHFNKKLI